MEIPFIVASGRKSSISCSTHEFNSTFSTCKVLCPTSIFRTFSTMFRSSFMRPDCLLILCMMGYFSSSGDKVAKSCFSGACIKVSGVRNSWLMLIRKRTFSSYTCCSCSFMAHFSLFSLRRSKEKNTSTMLENTTMMQLIVNQPDLYQGGSTINSSIW